MNTTGAAPNWLIHPTTLLDGQNYFLKNQGASDPQADFVPVQFISYTPCPAYVIVANPDGQRIRCTRDDVYLITGFL